MKKNIGKILFVSLFMAFSSCDTFDLDQNADPSALSQEFIDPEYTFNYIQVTLPDFVNSSNSFTQRVTRQMAMTGGNTYNNAFSPENFDTNWITGYFILNAIKAMEPKAIANEQTYILGASKVIRCYVLMTLTDMYGNIPYSEALQGNSNLTPRFDSSADVYAGVYDELNQAIALLQNPSSDAAPLRDLYYGGAEGGGDKTRWIKLANTLKLKMLYTARLAGNIGPYSIQTEAAALMSSGDLILSQGDDFEFKYGIERELPNSRHPLYNDHYEFGGGAYIGNYFMWAVSREKQDPGAGEYPYFDPRTQFYFFRQVVSIDGDSQTIPCEDGNSKPEHYNFPQYYSFYDPTIETAYCTTDLDDPGTAFLGRDHGDNSGIPADADLRSVAGLYPAGGAISPRLGAVIVAGTLGEGGTRGALGQGIMPIMLSSYVHFMKAELALTLGVGGDPRAIMETAIRASITKVTTFLPDQAGRPPQATTDTKTEAYVTFVNSEFNAASPAQKLEILIKEYYVALWGNGIEAYNNYRRTGYPSNFQPTLELDSEQYFYTALYPAVSVNNNGNAPSNVRTRRVFWDLASLNLH